MVNAITFSEIDMACDVKQFISMSKDNPCADTLKDFIFKCEDKELLKITKKIASPIMITNAVKVDDAYIDKNL